MNKLFHVLKYLNGTKDLGFVLRAEKPLVVHGYIDTSYGVHNDATSHSVLADRGYMWVQDHCLPIPRYKGSSQSQLNLWKH